MKKELLTIKPALAGPEATSPTSRLAKVQDGRLWGYGGAFCISTPIESTLRCGFRPEPVLNFFQREREDVTITEWENRLILGASIPVIHQVEIETLPASQIPVLQAVGQGVAITDQLQHLDTVAKLSRNNTADFTQGAWFHNGMIFSMRGHAMVFSTNGLPEGCPNFGLPSDTLQALSRIKAPLSNVCWDPQCVQFEFEDGTWVACRTLDGLTVPDFLKIFENDQTEVPIEFTPGSVEEILNYKLDDERDGQVQDMIWRGKEGELEFTAPDRTTGFIEDAYFGGEDFCIKGESLRTVLALEPDDLLLKGQRALHGYGVDFAIAAALTRL